MKTMGAAKFKEQCLAVLDHLDAEAVTGQDRSFTRPLCAYPELAQYDGSSDPDDQSSFRCAVP